MRRPGVLLACSSDWSSPARLPGLLARAGCRVSVLCPADRPLLHTRFVEAAHDAPADLPGFVEAMRAHVLAHRYAWVIPIDDPLCAALSARRAEPWTAGLLPIDARHPASAAIASKAGFVAAAAAAGLPGPRSEVVHAPHEARAAAARLGFPLVVKRSCSFAGLGVRACEDLAALEAACEAWPDEPLVLQAFVDGAIGNTLFLFDHGRPICWMSARKVRTFPGRFGPSCARQVTDHADVEPILRAWGRATGYHGFGAFDWILDAAGSLQVIELNARPAPALHMGPTAGVDFARAVRELLAGEPHVQRPRDPGPTAPVSPMFPEDLYRVAVEGGGAWREWLPRAGRHHDIPWTDPPLLGYHVRTMIRGLRSLRDQG